MRRPAVMIGHEVGRLPSILRETNRGFEEGRERIGLDFGVDEGGGGCGERTEIFDES